ncbi:hypothetical protein K3U93_24570 [Mycobacterium malmoense]|uniref:Anti-sigma-M factor RsmA n=1 Tax=Mycobacterium malmoense TaxID=1780 RepID=A0ABX3SZT8_MYCMA|nr:hypothetical protein [Mycobacterium malmoense]ORA85323.1 hypothetical protein BST29_00115 [Mycobacterium malmoense]QZA17679.1 hypothetical protein K3U93_24570 [Mycobacterium malmoense]UNB94461.1 hypothetical protein H5T25_24555 [Mycobacterium malmoense]
MGESNRDPEDPADTGAEPPLTAELLADLQAGLLDDDSAARVRRRVRDDPEAETILRALNQVRRDVAALGADPASAPKVPPEVTARISTVLTSGQSQRRAGAAHSARPRIGPARLAAGAAGVGALLAAIGVGTAALINAPGPAPSTPVTAEHITVSTPPMAIPLSQEEILGLLDHRPDYGPLEGPLSDPPRRASCLSGLGYPASTQVLGARPIEINARPGVLLVLPGDTPDKLAAFAVALNCSAADTGLLASTQVARP